MFTPLEQDLIDDLIKLEMDTQTIKATMSSLRTPTQQDLM